MERPAEGKQGNSSAQLYLHLCASALKTRAFSAENGVSAHSLKDPPEVPSKGGVALTLAAAVQGARSLPHSSCPFRSHGT